MNVHKVGLTVGSFVGLLHLAWEVLIFLGVAQKLMDFKLAMHSLNNPFVVQPFNLGRGVIVIVLATAAGYIVGALFAALFNRLHS
jgi:hypothetical protein